MEDKEIMRGRFEECWAHYIDNLPPKGSKGVAEAKKPLAEFCNVLVDTVTSWTSGRAQPIGLTKFQIMCFLQAMGYTITELGRKSALITGLIEILGYGVMTVEEVNGRLGYANESQLFSALRGDYNLSEDKEHTAWEIYKAHTETLADKKRARVKQLRGSVSAEVKVSRTAVSAPSKVRQPELSGLRPASDQVRLTAHLIQALQLQLELLTKRLDADGRRALRQLTDDAMTKLQTQLTQLSAQMVEDLLGGKP